MCKRYKLSDGFSWFSISIRFVFENLFICCMVSITNAFEFLQDSPSVSEDRQLEKQLVLTKSYPLDLNVHLFLRLHVQVLLPVSSCKHSHPVDCLPLLLTVISQRNTGCQCTCIICHMVVCMVHLACVFLSGSVDQTAHDATLQRISMTTHEVEVVVNK